MLINKKITFIGGGNMASSIIGGLIKQGFNAKNITVSDLNQAMLDKLSERKGVAVSTSNTKACDSADVILLAIKPQVLQEVCSELSGSLTSKQLIISIAAGIDIASLSRWLNSSSIVRAMPNTPALIGEGACGLYSHTTVTKDQKSMAEDILSAVGITSWVDKEALIDAVTALSGSGPAYFFLFIEAMTKSGISLGIDPKTAEKLAIQTAYGATKLAKKSEVDILELRRQVTSPNGTTEKAIESFVDGGLFETVDKAMEACAQRAKDLTVELAKD